MSVNHGERLGKALALGSHSSDCTLQLSWSEPCTQLPRTVLDTSRGRLLFCWLSRSINERWKSFLEWKENLFQNVLVLKLANVLYNKSGTKQYTCSVLVDSERFRVWRHLGVLWGRRFIESYQSHIQSDSRMHKSVQEVRRRVCRSGPFLEVSEEVRLGGWGNGPSLQVSEEGGSFLAPCGWWLVTATCSQAVPDFLVSERAKGLSRKD